MIKQPIKYFLLSLMILESLFVIAQHPEIDKKAPKIEITEWVTNELNGENPFQGKTIILEFWTTWCAPCLAALPHLNKLSDEFAGEKVVFLSITYEKREKVEKLLTRKTFKSTVVIDTTKNTLQAFGVKSIPK
ncbi:MAG: TlpA family protein disulfide reductase, partial [Bacteroidetes bacterium]|nr:TlpA family protein disulfide reductase [Bacteroidota bacterium]